MKHIKLELQKLEERIAPSAGGGNSHHSDKSHGSNGNSHGSKANSNGSKHGSK